MNNENLIEKLDLSGYLEEFNALCARKKPLFLEGDSRLHFERIKELFELDFTPPTPCENLTQRLVHLSKQGILHLNECFEFVKIFRYFAYLKGLKFELALKAWLDKIIIPLNLISICEYFNEKGELKEELDERLVRLNEADKIKSEQIQSHFKELLSSKALQGYLIDTQIHFIHQSECLLVKAGHKIKAKIIARSANGGFYILPENIEKLQIEKEKIYVEREKIHYEYAVKISQIFHKELGFLKFIDKTYDTFDAYSARVLLARKKDYEIMLCDKSKDIILKDFAHPALKNAKSVSVSFTKQVLLVTGVNAGGKSMLLKGILSAAFLAKHLLPMKINAAHSKIGKFSGIKAIIDDPQNVKNDISTFAGRMLEFSRLLQEKNLLLGVDEIELGTDFEEAASLYTVLTQSLISKGFKIIITTHHKRLAMLLARNEEVELLAALFDEKMALPRFEFLQGTVGKSYAFETALRYGIAANLVELARKINGENKQNLEELVGKNINLELELRQKLKLANQSQSKAEALLNSLKNQKEENDKSLKNTLSRLENAYYEAIEAAKKSLNLKDTKDKQRAINKANELKKHIEKPKFTQTEDLKVGDLVSYNAMRGEILSIKKDEAIVESEGLRLRVGLSLLKKSLSQTRSNFKATVSIEKKQNANMSLDLHGLRADEALSELEAFISDALMAGFEEVIIFHGIGTGKLAALVKDFLSTHKSVKSFEDAPINQGGFGAKVVKF